MQKTTRNSPLAIAKGLVAGCLAALLLGPALAWAMTAAGSVTHMSGVLAAKGSDGKIRVLNPKSEVYSGDVLNTEKNSYARIKFTDGGEVVLRPDSQFKIDAYHFKEDEPSTDSASFGLVKGGLRAITGAVGKRNRDNFSMKTPAATIGIRGTHFGAIFCQDDCGGLASPSGKVPDNGLHLDVSEGAVALTNGAGTQLVNAGEFGFVRAPDVPPVLVPPEQAVKPPAPPAGAVGGLFGKDGSPEGCKMR